MKQILFSRHFPVGHPRAGEPTWFVEKIWRCLCDTERFYELAAYEQEFEQHFPCQYTEEEDVMFHQPKHHTIRSGHRWKAGEWFVPKVWSGKPYRSKCIQFAPPIQIKKIYEIEIDINGVVSLDGYYSEDVEITAKLAMNDGLTEWDFHNWFSDLPFNGQVIIWNENIQYS